MIVYLVKWSIYLLLFYVFYELFLKREKAFVFNRIYLLFALIIAFVLPVFQFELSFFQTSNFTELVQTDLVENWETEFTQQKVTKQEVNVQGQNKIPNSNLVFLIYLIVGTLLLIRFLKNLYYLNREFKSAEKYNINNRTIYLSKSGITACSFFSKVLINRDLFKEKEVSEKLIEHEFVHAKQKHSLDRVIMELLSVVFWFQPLLIIYKRAIKVNHEFLADEHVYKSHGNKQAYFHEIIKLNSRNIYIQLASSFNYSSIKQRIMMATKTNVNKKRLGSKLAVCSLLLASAFVFLSMKSDSMVKILSGKKVYTVLLDPGHGGKDNGATVQAISENGPFEAYEKDYNLELAKLMKELNSNDKVKILLTREADEFLSLKERKDIANEKADLLVSLHMNANVSDEKNGMIIYCSPEAKNKDNSIRLMENFCSIEKIREGGSITEFGFANFAVLDVECPAVSLHIGAITNNKDFQYISENRKEIAERLLQVIEKSVD